MYTLIICSILKCGIFILKAGEKLKWKEAEMDKPYFRHNLQV